MGDLRELGGERKEVLRDETGDRDKAGRITQEDYQLRSVSY